MLYFDFLKLNYTFNSMKINKTYQSSLSNAFSVVGFVGITSITTTL
jgi:hypothetical protein